MQGRRATSVSMSGGGRASNVFQGLKIPPVRPRPSACRVRVREMHSANGDCNLNEQTREGTRSTCHSRRQNAARPTKRPDDGRWFRWRVGSEPRNLGSNRGAAIAGDTGRGGRDKRAKQSDSNKIPERTDDDHGDDDDGYCGHIITPASRPQTAGNQTRRQNPRGRTNERTESSHWSVMIAGRARVAELKMQRTPVHANHSRRRERESDGAPI